MEEHGTLAMSRQGRVVDDCIVPLLYPKQSMYADLHTLRVVSGVNVGKYAMIRCLTNSIADLSRPIDS